MNVEVQVRNHKGVVQVRNGMFGQHDFKDGTTVSRLCE